MPWCMPTWATVRTEGAMNNRRHPSRLTRIALEAAFSLAFFGAAAHHVAGHDFRPLVALCAPILILYYGLSSLLFVRGKALAEGPWQRRSLHAAERATQATVWHVLGIVVGISAYGLLGAIEARLEAPLQVAAMFLLFAAPYALMQAGLLSFLRAIWTISPHLTRQFGVFEARRRVLARRNGAGVDLPTVGRCMMPASTMKGA